MSSCFWQRENVIESRANSNYLPSSFRFFDTATHWYNNTTMQMVFHWSISFLPFTFRPYINPWRQAFSVKFTCLKNHTYSWQSVSLEYNHSVPEVVSFTYHAALSRGLSFTHLKELLAGLELKVPERGHFYDFQKGDGRNLGWADAVLHIWKKRKLTMYELLKTQCSPIIVYINARYVFFTIDMIHY